MKARPNIHDMPMATMPSTARDCPKGPRMNARYYSPLWQGRSPRHLRRRWPEQTMLHTAAPPAAGAWSTAVRDMAFRKETGLKRARCLLSDAITTLHSIEYKYVVFRDVHGLRLLECGEADESPADKSGSNEPTHPYFFRDRLSSAFSDIPPAVARSLERLTQPSAHNRSQIRASGHPCCRPRLPGEAPTAFLRQCAAGIAAFKASAPRPQVKYRAVRPFLS